MEFKILEKVLEANENLASEIRVLLRKRKVGMVNLISSPGSGKTTILEKTIPILKERYRIGIIEGDVETDRDAQRLKRFDLPMVLINTLGACHLDSESILKALEELPLQELDIVFVENVGNLVCPAEFDIGEKAKVAVISTPEGDDKPQKYPLLFREAEVVLLNKIDLLGSLNFDRNHFYRDLHNLNSHMRVIEMSAYKEEGLEEWIEWLETKVFLKEELKLYKAH